MAERLGACPVEELRAAWAETIPLEAVAVEQEVLRLCTERADRIAAFLEAQADLDAELSGLLAPAPAPAPAPPEPPAAASVPALPFPEDGPAAASLPAPPAEPVPESPQAAAGRGPGGAAAAGAPAADAALASAGDPGPAARAAALLPLPAADWRILYVARAADGPWRAALRREATVVALPEPPPLPSADPISAAAAGEEPAPVLVSVPEETILVAEGDALPDGARVARIDPGGVAVRDGGGGAAGAAVRGLSWAEAADASAPGSADWTFTVGAPESGGAP